jgi:hypothetical protein
VNCQRSSSRIVGSIDPTFAIKQVRTPPFSPWSVKDSASPLCRARRFPRSWKESQPFRLIHRMHCRSVSRSGQWLRRPPQPFCFCKQQSHGSRSRPLCFQALVELPRTGKLRRAALLCSEGTTYLYAESLPSASINELLRVRKRPATCHTVEAPGMPGSRDSRAVTGQNGIPLTHGKAPGMKSTGAQESAHR